MFKSVPIWCAAALAMTMLGSGCSSPAKPPISQYNMGEKVPVGRLSYTVFETQWLTHLGEGASARVPQNRFFLVRLSAVNGGSSDTAIPTLTLEDDKGQKYEELSNGDGVPQWIGFLRTARPADSVQGNVVFDVPPGHYKMTLTDEDQSHAARVDIPLSFGAETPEVLSPGDPRKQ
jgi:Domain of unknown function (DUF4352)